MMVFKELYDGYIVYCCQNGYIPESNKSFGKRLDEIGFERRIGTGNKLYVYAEDETRQELS